MQNQIEQMRHNSVAIWQNARTLVDGLSVREQGLLSVTGAIVILLLLDSFFLQGTFKEITISKNSLVQKEEQLNAVVVQLIQVENTLKNGANQETSFREKQFEKKMAKFKLKESEFQKVFVSAQNMPMVLKDILQSVKKLNLNSIKSLTPLYLETSNINDKYSKTLVYEHRMEVSLEGEYFEIAEALGKIEALKWPLIWARLEYSVKEYPRAKVKLTLHTLSDTVEWIGV